jgi:hypothetical protein
MIYLTGILPAAILPDVYAWVGDTITAAARAGRAPTRVREWPELTVTPAGVPIT